MNCPTQLHLVGYFYKTPVVRLACFVWNYHIDVIIRLGLCL